MKLAIFLFLMFAAFSTENSLKRKRHKKAISECKNNDKFPRNSKTTPKLVPSLVLNLVEEYLEAQNSIKLKMTHKKWSKLEITGNLNILPNESSVKFMRNMETSEIFWDDPKNLIRKNIKWKIESFFQQKSEAMSNLLFDYISNRIIPKSEPFFRELMLPISEYVAIERRGGDRKTPLSLAAKLGAQRAIAKLIERGANVEAVGKFNLTALHFAVKVGNESCCKFLLEKHANINAKTESNHTPLMMAAFQSNAKIVKILLEYGADTEVSKSCSVRRGNEYSPGPCADLIPHRQKMISEL